MIEVFFAIIYASLFGFVIFKLEFFKLESIEKKPLLALFVIKLVVGFVYIYISKNVISAGDVFSYYKDGLIVHGRLLEGDFSGFLQLTFGLNNVAISENIAQSVHLMGYWHDTSAYMVVRLNALINVFTFGSGIYASAVFFVFLSFLACVFLAKIFELKLEAKSTFLYYAIFLTPSLCFWTSGMHKEALSVFLIALILYSFFRSIKAYKTKYLISFLLSFALLYETRFFIAAMLLPPILAYLVWFYLKKYRPLPVFTLFFMLILGLTYVVPAIFQTSNLVDEVLARKALYEALDNGNTAINLGEYKPSYVGILEKVPQALFNSLVRPHFLDIHSWFLGIAAVESFLLSCTFIISLFYLKLLNQEERAVIFLFFGFAMSYLILTGLIVPNLGAILRYRSVALFLLVPSIAFLLEKRNAL